MAAYIMIESKRVCFWQVSCYIRNGWDVVKDGWPRVSVERCTG